VAVQPAAVAGEVLRDPRRQPGQPVEEEIAAVPREPDGGGGRQALDAPQVEVVPVPAETLGRLVVEMGEPVE
jgi:hypothetical protein